MLMAVKQICGSERRAAVALMVLANCLWSLGGVLIKEVTWHPVAIAGARSAIALVIFWFVFGRQSLSFSRVQIAGAIAYAVTLLLFVCATKLTTAANAILLQYTMPIYIALFSAWFLHEPPTRSDWVTIAVMAGGMGLFFLDQLSSGGLLGNICAIGSGISLAVVFLCMRKQKSESPAGTVLLGNLITVVVAVPFMWGSAPEPGNWLNIVLLGVFQVGLAYICFTTAIKHLTALECSLLGALEPVLNPLWVFLLLGERPGSWAMVGGAVIIAAVIGRCFKAAGVTASEVNNKLES